MKTILLLLIPLLSITTLFAQQHNKSIFDSELSAEDAYIPFHNTITKSNDNKLNLLFNYWTDPNKKTFDIALDVLQSDTFYYVLGCLANSRTPMLTKFDMHGNQIWERKDTTYRRKSVNSWVPSTTIIQQTNNKILYCYYNHLVDTIHNRYIEQPSFVSVDEDNNNKMIITNWPDSIDYFPTAIIADKNSGFTSVGGLNSKTLQLVTPGNGSAPYYIPDTIYLYIVSFDSSMNVIKKQKLFFTFQNCNTAMFFIEDLEKSHDGGYIVGGHIGDCGGINGWASSKCFAVKFDSLLNHQWTKVYEDSIAKDDSPFNITPSRDGSSYIYTRGHTKTQSIAYGKFDENGDIIWEKYFRKTLDSNYLIGGALTIYDRPYGVIEKANGDIIFGSRINWNRATGLVRTDSVGNVKWSRIIGTNYGDSLLHYSYIFNLKNPIGEGALLVGRVHTKGAFLIRTDSLGCTLPNCLDTTLHVGIEEILELKEKKLIIYPNPAQNQIQIAINQQGAMVKQIIVYNISGKEIQRRTANSYLVNMDISRLAKGVYIVKVESSLGDIRSSKFIKQ